MSAATARRATSGGVIMSRHPDRTTVGQAKRRSARGRSCSSPSKGASGVSEPVTRPYASATSSGAPSGSGEKASSRVASEDTRSYS